ncbi:MAG TPA: SDR family oxidoreductase [Anaerolineales bacterium]|nr:SDR family oxidoreductase [Anaerolineales bacterium]
MTAEQYPLAIVTGAAHRLGREFALSLARQRFAVLLHYQHSERQAEQTRQDVEALGVPAILVRADLSAEKGIAGLIEALDNILSRKTTTLRVLVNSAAVMPRQDLSAIRAGEWDATLDLNLRAPLLLSQKAAERMPEGSLIVNITDVAAKKLWTNYPAYVVSKSALETLTRLLAKQLAPSIRVNAIAPGLVLPAEEMGSEEWARLVDRLPLGHSASVDEITGTLNFLIKNTSITGQTIVVDGGYSLI